MKRRTAKKQIKKYYKKYLLGYTKANNFCSEHFPENYKEIVANGLAKEINYLLSLVRYNNTNKLLLFNRYKKECEISKPIRYIICDLVSYYFDNDYFYTNYETLYM